MDDGRNGAGCLRRRWHEMMEAHDLHEKASKYDFEVGLNDGCHDILHVLGYVCDDIDVYIYVPSSIMHIEMHLV
jgi:hypothetical protein